MDERLKEVSEDVDRKKALKDVVVATTKDKGEVATAVGKRAANFEKARALAKQRLAKLDVKLGSTELKLMEVESLNLSQVDKIADLKAALGACEDKWYDASFTEAENFVEPVVHNAWKLGFQEG